MCVCVCECGCICVCVCLVSLLFAPLNLTFQISFLIEKNVIHGGEGHVYVTSACMCVVWGVCM